MRRTTLPWPSTQRSPIRFKRGTAADGVERFSATADMMDLLAV
jgi:hypothetical protein